MVHALEMTHSLLKTDGLFIDIHPTGQPPRVEVHTGREIHLAGHLQETNDFIEYFQADDALANVTGRGLFELDHQAQFTFLLHAPTIIALADHLTAEWSDAVLPAETIARAAELMNQKGEGENGRREIILREYVHIARYQKIGRLAWRPASYG